MSYNRITYILCNHLCNARRVGLPTWEGRSKRVIIYAFMVRAKSNFVEPISISLPNGSGLLHTFHLMQIIGMDFSQCNNVMGDIRYAMVRV